MHILRLNCSEENPYLESDISDDSGFEPNEPESDTLDES